MEKKDNVQLLKDQLALFAEREKVLMKQFQDQSELLSYQSIQIKTNPYRSKS